MRENRPALVYIALLGLVAAIGLVKLALTLGQSVSAALQASGAAGLLQPSLAYQLGQLLIALSLAIVVLITIWDRPRGRVALRLLTPVLWLGAVLNGIAWFALQRTSGTFSAVWPLILALVGVAAPTLLEQGVRWIEKQEDIARTGGPERAVRAEITLNVGIAKVWEAWVTEEGCRSFLAPECRIEPEAGGAYEAYFDLEAAPGERGSEGSRVMALQPPNLLSIAWSAPATFPAVRSQRTHVQVRLEDMAFNQTKVTLIQDGWGEGPEWDEAYRYFSHIWAEIVLPRLRYRFLVAPVDWKNPPGGA